MDYYKALRPDGTDFATGTTKPRKGRWMPRIKGKLIMCERGYHVSDAVAETLIGGSWPCKLARVEVPEGDWEREGHKLVVPTYRVVEWLPAWQALGPNGEDVAALIARAQRLTPDEIERLSAAESAAELAARSAAESAAELAAESAAGWAARLAAELAAWSAAWWAARLAARSAARSAAWSAARLAAESAARSAAWSAAGWAARSAAGWAARSAAWSLVARDLITPEQFDTLYGPWASVMEEHHG